MSQAGSGCALTPAVLVRPVQRNAFVEFEYSIDSGELAVDLNPSRRHDVVERRFDGNFKGHKAYLCGPPPMIEAAIRTLMRGRLFEKDIYTERFVTQMDGAAALARTPLFKRL
jgi:NAD(P)H-flavin reductase